MEYLQVSEKYCIGFSQYVFQYYIYIYILISTILYMQFNYFQHLSCPQVLVFMDNWNLIVPLCFTGHTKHNKRQKEEIKSKIVPKVTNKELHGRVHTHVLSPIHFDRGASKKYSDVVHTPIYFLIIILRRRTQVCKSRTCPCTFEKLQSMFQTRAQVDERYMVVQLKKLKV